jgi:S-DNA-T family DNA segregation ATPase FtsK/SpoIIIE
VVFESVSGHPDYRFPPISLLRDEPISGSVDPRDCEAVARKLVETLASFGVRTTLQNISHGPAITRYELLPDVGVRVKSIANLADDISMRLASSGVRIEAPIPGKEAVGIEVPNKKVDIVYVRQLIDTDEFRNAPGKLTTCLGMDVAGKPIFCDLAKMPHLLVAGATGMGKSACINSLLTSILYKATPEEVKLILIDPKKVEFGIFNGLPHLLVPVVTDPRKAAGALCWAVAEMDRRFTLIENMNVRNVQAYNQAIAGNPAAERLPQVVIIIDELADLMMTARDEVEGSICRLAQKARAAGMHLCIATQRPSTDVITGLMKANIPSRIAFTVASQVDSRVIIDMMGAEKLIGRGDMLYSPVGLLKPMRVQGAFITDSEVEAVTDFIRQAVTTEYDDEVMASIEQNAAMCGGKGKKGYDEEENDITEPRITLNDDPLLIRAAELALSQGSIAVSQLQRDLQVGYPRAGALVDKLHKLGVVGAYCGSKPRPITMTYEEFQELRMRQDSKFG